MIDVYQIATDVNEANGDDVDMVLAGAQALARELIDNALIDKSAPFVDLLHNRLHELEKTQRERR